ncbi:MAG: hypothetical protein ACRCXZ_08400, partial [Patescibacteria group bacterium]
MTAIMVTAGICFYHNISLSNNSFQIIQRDQKVIGVIESLNNSTSTNSSEMRIVFGQAVGNCKTASITNEDLKKSFANGRSDFAFTSEGNSLLKVTTVDGDGKIIEELI